MNRKERRKRKSQNRSDRKKISALWSEINAKKTDREAFLSELWNLSLGKVRNGRIYRGSSNSPIRLFRSRVFEKLPLPTEASAYSYPPSNASLGRANSQGKPVFYCSAGGPTTFVEAKCEVGSIVAVAEFRIYCAMVVQEIAIQEQSVTSEYERFLTEIFSRPGDTLYPYSSKIAEHLLQGKNINALLYPSIASNNQSQNLAIKTDFCDKNVRLANITAYEITSIQDKFKYDVNEIDFATVSQEDVCWKGRKKQWVLREKGQQFKMVSSGWNWDAYDENDCLVDPE